MKTARGGMIDVTEMSRWEDEATDLDEETENIEQRLDDVAAQGDQQLKSPSP